MNSAVYCIFLGIIQGLTEFIPISSSAHLVIFQEILGIKEHQVFFDIVLHLGTLFAVIIYFYKDIINIIRFTREGSRMLALLFIGTIPAGVAGIFLKDFIETIFSSPVSVSVLLAITGIVLYATKYIKKDTTENISILDALIIGFAQMFAIAPGLSRSGMTISTGIFRGIERKRCARFSLLLSIPAITGALVVKSGDIKELNSLNIFNILLGFLSAFLVGYIAIKVLVKVLEKAKFYIFAYYCWIVGGITFVYFL